MVTKMADQEQPIEEQKVAETPAEDAGGAIPEEQTTPAEETAPSGTPQPDGDASPGQTEDAPGTPQADAAAEDTQATDDAPDEEKTQEADGEDKPAEGEHTEQGEESAEGKPAADDEQKEGDDEAAGGEQQEGQQEEQQEREDSQQPDGEQDGQKSPVPQSDTFAEGERAESPIAVGEKLSREGSPIGEQEQELDPETLQEQADEDMQRLSPPVPGTPERVSVIGEEEDDEEADEEGDDEEEEYEDEEEEFEEEEEPQFDRDQLIEKYHQALAERQQLQDQNYQLQHKLADYFQKKKSDDTRQDMDKNVTDQEQRYLKYMANLDDLRRQDTEEREMFKMQIEELKDRCQDKQERVNDEQFKFMEFKKQIGLQAVNSRSGKAIAPRDIEQYLATETRKEHEVVNVRLENIKLKNKLKKKEMQLKSKEELAEGLHLIDFEQLKIENQTYNEKIEERNEELLKLRKKITSTVEVLTHLKEKLQFVQGENGGLKGKLRTVEEKAGKKRDILSRTKQARDALRIDNQRLRQSCGLLGNEPLLRDFEERKDEGDDLRSKLESLKMQHAELTLNLNGVRRKIDQAKVGGN